MTVPAMTVPGRLRRATAAVVCVLSLTAAAACSVEDGPGATNPNPDPTTPTATEPPPAPTTGTCHRIGFRQALSPTATGKERPCRAEHTAETFSVGTLDLMVDGHQLAVDSDRVQQQVAAACPPALARYVGGDPETLRLSMIRPVWFTPTLEQADLGAEWYRCDAVVVGGDQRLVPVTGSLRGALGTEKGVERYAMCGTAAPDDPKFDRVVCSAPHSWRAISVVPFDPGRYPGEARVKGAGDGCEDAALDHVDDPLQDWGWAYEWPTKEQWDAGTTFGRCWVTAP